MSHSLQDQLLRAGLVDEKSAKKAAKDKRKKRRQEKSGAAQVQTPPSGRQRAEELARRDKMLNQQRVEARKAKELDAQIRQIIESHRISLEDGEAGYNFVDGGKVKRLYVSESLHSRIVKGRIGIVELEGEYVLIPAETASKIEARAQGRVLVLNQADEKPTGDDDPYAEYQVPDDLIW